MERGYLLGIGTNYYFKWYFGLISPTGRILQIIVETPGVKHLLECVSVDPGV